MKLKIIGARFENCMFGIKAAGIRAADSWVTENAFTSEYENMKAPYTQVTESLRNRNVTQVGLWLQNSSFSSEEQFTGNSFHNMGIGVLGENLGSIQYNIFTDCHIASILGRGCSNLSYHDNDITLPTDPTLRYTIQMSSLGSEYVHNPMYNSAAPLEGYTYGLYFKQECDNIYHTFQHNFIRSNDSDAYRHHVGMANDGWSQKAHYLENEFTNLSIGIRGFNDVCHFNIRKNKFIDNEVAISLEEPYDPNRYYWLDLKCNTFTHTLSDPVSATPNRKGLVIGSGVKVGSYDPFATSGVVENVIGGTFPKKEYPTITDPQRPYPNANVWPTATPRNTPRVILPNGDAVDLHDPGDGWMDSPNWISIENNSTNTISYFRYENEFVKNNLPQPNPNNILYPIGPMRITTGTINPDPTVYEMACDNFTDDQIILFPARVAVVSELTGMAKDKDHIYLSDPIPNPAETETRILINLPSKSEQALLQIVETSSGKVLQNIALKGFGQQEVILDLSLAPAGVYSYRLLLNGIPSGTKKLVLIK